MLLLLLLGILCYRCRLIDESGNKMLANILLMVVNPMLAITSMQIEFHPHLVTGLLLSYALAAVTHIIAILISTALIRPETHPECSIDRFCCMYSNCGFIGIPLVQSILGGEGVLYLTAYMTTFNLFSWTHGVAIMTGKMTWKDLKKGLLAPMILGSLLGLILFLTRIQLPAILFDAMDYVAGMNTPLAMIIAGVAVAQTDLRKMLSNKRLYLISFGKLLIMPALVLAALAVLRLDSTVALTLLIAAACPVAASSTAFALRFHRNYQYASELYAFSTLLSLVTIPMFLFAAERLLTV